MKSKWFILGGAINLFLGGASFEKFLGNHHVDTEICAAFCIVSGLWCLSSLSLGAR